MATASLLPPARSVFYDFNGNPLAGGFVSTFVPNSTTPKLSWQDAGETTPNTNPIILDSAGSCLLYGAGSYQLTVTDSLGNQVPAYSGLSQDAASVVGISAAMQPVVSAATTSLATGLLTYLDPGAGAVPVSLDIPLSDFILPAFYGAKGDGIADDTVAVQKAITTAQIQSKAILLKGTVGTTFNITAPLTIGAGYLRIFGANGYSSSLVAGGNFASIISFGAAAAGVLFQSVGLVTTGTTTQCIKFAQGSQGIKFENCLFSGDLSGILIYSQAAGYVEYWGCTWGCNSVNTQGIVLDGFNQNTVFMGGHAGGPGQWLVLENTGGDIANNVQGLKATAFTSICTGPFAIQISGAAFANEFIGCIIDQAGSSCVIIEGGASLTKLIGGYYGLANPTVGIPILLANSAGPGTTINAVQTYGGSSAIQIQASVSSRVAGVVITNNVFAGAQTDTISLDSVNGCIITGNQDLSTPTNGSWATSATFGPGAYTFGNNDWWTSGPAAFDAGSSYHATPDRGITLANKGVAASVSGTSIVVNHGLTSVAPNVIKITQLGGTGMNSNVSAISGSTFTITYGTAGAATFMWEAEYYT